jgi:Uma2 family endonuclease
MALAPPPATAKPSGLEPALLMLPWDLRLTPEQFERVCQVNPEAVLELTAEGHLIVMTPTGGETSSRNGQLLYQLQVFCRRHKGWRLFDSSGGFRLPDGSVLSPDAALVLEDRWQTLSWRGGQQGMAERLENASRVDGSELVEGLELGLEEIWVV